LPQALDAAQGLSYLHKRSQPVVHRRLSLHSLILTPEGGARVGGLESARLRPRGDDPRRAAPEVLQGCGATPASDVYSFGVVLWELLTWEEPWGHLGGGGGAEVAARVAAGGRPAVPPPGAAPGGEALACHAAYAGLVQRCWAQAPAARPTAGGIVRELRALGAAAGGDGGALAALALTKGAGWDAAAGPAWRL
jgi:hypothetical protein